MQSSIYITPTVFGSVMVISALYYCFFFIRAAEILRVICLVMSYVGIALSLIACGILAFVLLAATPAFTESMKLVGSAAIGLGLSLSYT